jgi:hypothetical protein
MALFRRSVRAAPAPQHQSLGDFRIVMHSNASRMALVAPTRFPDGTPYPTEQHLHDLAEVAVYARAHAGAEEKALVERILLLMVMIRDLRKDEPDMAPFAACADARQWFVARGLEEQSRIMGTAGLAIMKFWDQSGVLDKALAETEF